MHGWGGVEEGQRRIWAGSQVREHFDHSQRSTGLCAWRLSDKCHLRGGMCMGEVRTGIGRRRGGTGR